MNDSASLQAKLNSILQLCLSFVHLETKAQMNQLQSVLVDYENNEDLANIVENVLKLAQKYKPKYGAMVQPNMVQEEEYRKLEILLQAFEAKQRQSIQNENHLRLYCEQLQNKIKDAQDQKNKLMQNTNKIILDLNRQNHQLMEKLKISALKQIQQNIPYPVSINKSKGELSFRNKLDQHYHSTHESVGICAVKGTGTGTGTVIGTGASTGAVIGTSTGSGTSAGTSAGLGIGGEIVKADAGKVKKRIAPFLRQRINSQKRNDLFCQ